MKRQLVLMLLLSASFLTYSQYKYNKSGTNRTYKRDGATIISASPNLLLYTPNGTQIAGGIKIQLFLDKRFSFDADLVFSRDYIHYPGTIGIPLFIIGSIIMNAEGGWIDNMGVIGTGIFGSIGYTFFFIGFLGSLEHFSYHIPVKNNLDISPYLCLFRHKYSYEFDNYSDPDFTGEQYCFASGVQINKYIGRFVLSPYTEYNIGYKDHISGLNIGIYCGILFPSKKNFW